MMAVASGKRNGKGTRKAKKKRHQLYLRCYGLSISFRGKIHEMLALILGGELILGIEFTYGCRITLCTFLRFIN